MSNPMTTDHPGSTASDHLRQLWQRGTDLLGSRYAIMGGAMSWVSERHLVSALSNAGAFGVLAASSMPPALLDQEIKATQALTRALSDAVISRSLPSSRTCVRIIGKTNRKPPISSSMTMTATGVSGVKVA